MENKNLYLKINSNARPSKEMLTESDYDAVVSFIKEGFPKARRIHQDMDETMKRTFVMGNVGKVRNTKKQQHADAATGRLRGNKKAQGKKQVPKKLPFKELIKFNRIWNEYIKELVRENMSPASVQDKLNRADFHGAFIKVVQANCINFIGLEGIVIKETKHTFVIINRSNFSKTLPKSQTVFDVPLDDPFGTIRICGNSFISRSAERSSKKIKLFMEFLGTKLCKLTPAEKLSLYETL